MMHTLELPMYEFDTVARCCSLRPWLTFQSARRWHLDVSTRNESLIFCAVQSMMHNLLWVFAGLLDPELMLRRFHVEKLKSATSMSAAFNIGVSTNKHESRSDSCDWSETLEFKHAPLSRSAWDAKSLLSSRSDRPHVADSHCGLSSRKPHSHASGKNSACTPAAFGRNVTRHSRMFTTLHPSIDCEKTK